jgi:hypothetical protein
LQLVHHTSLPFSLVCSWSITLARHLPGLQLVFQRLSSPASFRNSTRLVHSFISIDALSLIIITNKKNVYSTLLHA